MSKRCFFYTILGCWQNYLKIEIQENKQKIKCPGHKCTLIMDENAVIELVDDPTITSENEHRLFY